MRKLRASLVPVIAILLITVACAGASPQRVALNTLQAVRATVVTAVQTFNVGYQSGQFSEQNRTDLGVLYNKYLTADTAAAQALLVVTDTQASAIAANVTNLANDVILFVQALKPPTPAPVPAPASAATATHGV